MKTLRFNLKDIPH